MTKGKRLTSEDISAIVDAFGLIDMEEMQTLAKLPPSQRIILLLEESEMIRSDIRNKLPREFPELSLPEINMKVLRSLTPVRMGKSYTEPAYYGWLC